MDIKQLLKDKNSKKEDKKRDSITLPFGKYKGENIEHVPASYLLWCYDQSWLSIYPHVLEHIRGSKRHLETEALEEEIDYSNDWQGGIKWS